MGNNKWSMRDNAQLSADDHAPTYRQDDAVVRVIRDMPQELNLSVREVTPDKPRFMVSVTRAADTGFPRWGNEEDGGVTPHPQTMKAVRGSHAAHTAGTNVAGTVKRVSSPAKEAGSRVETRPKKDTPAKKVKKKDTDDKE